MIKYYMVNTLWAVALIALVERIVYCLSTLHLFLLPIGREHFFERIVPGPSIILYYLKIWLYGLIPLIARLFSLRTLYLVAALLVPLVLSSLARLLSWRVIHFEHPFGQLIFASWIVVIQLVYILLFFLLLRFWKGGLRSE